MMTDKAGNDQTISSQVETAIDHINSLTPREIEVLSILSQGKLYKEICIELKISMNTVKKHIKNIYRKLQVDNRTKAMRKYL